MSDVAKAHRKRMRPVLLYGLLACILVSQGTLLAVSAVKHAPTWDEVGHLAAGISHWEFGNFSQYSVNPPLVRTVATAPVALLMNPKLDWQDFSKDPRQRTEVFVGRRLIDNNPADFLQFFTVARWACIPFVLLGSLICFLWSRDLFGDVAGLVSATTWAFSPMVLGHGALITPDVAAASLGITSFYAFRSWLRKTSWPGTAIMSVTFALALLAKSTWLIGLLIIPLVWIVWRLLESRQTAARKTKWLRDSVQLFCCALLVLTLVNAFYGFEGSLRPLGEYEFVSTKLAGRKIADRRTDSDNRFQGTRFAGLPVPLPANLVHGIDIQRFDFEVAARRSGWPSYLFGERRVGGWWYYYLAGYAVKEPLPWIIALSLSLPFVILRKLPGCSGREAAVLLIPAVTILVLVSSQTDMNRHLRYALPALPFLFVWTGQFAALLQQGNAWSRTLCTAMLIWFVGGTLYYAPHHLSYFNETVGGPKGGHRALTNSNLDWGQDLLYLLEWMDAHPEAEGMRIAYFGCFDPRVLGVQYKHPAPCFEPSDRQYQKLGQGPNPGWYAVSANYVIGSRMNVPNGEGEFIWYGEPAYTYFQNFEPVDRAGYSIWIYHLQEREVDAVRKKLNLPPLKSSTRL